MSRVLLNGFATTRGTRCCDDPDPVEEPRYCPVRSPAAPGAAPCAGATMANGLVAWTTPGPCVYCPPYPGAPPPPYIPPPPPMPPPIPPFIPIPPPIPPPNGPPAIPTHAVMELPSPPKPESCPNS